MKASDLQQFLLALEMNGHDLTTIDVNYREHFDSDVFAVTGVAEDLYDENTNSVVTSIVLAHRMDDGEDTGDE